MSGRKIIWIVSVFLLVLLSCEKDKFYSEKDAQLSFSEDTVFFDTIFTTIGTITKRFTVRNNYDQSVKISSISIATGENSKFRMNVDGIAANTVRDIVIRAKDSLYILVEATIDPNNHDSIMVIHDSIVFNTNGNMQDVDLIAFGQDMHLYRNAIIETETFINDKPYLIYNYLFVDSTHTLTIEAGTQLFFHRYATLIVKGRLVVNGEYNNPVVFRGDRMDKVYTGLPYDRLPGQWNGIFLLPQSDGSRINYAVIRNAVIGIQVGLHDAKVEPRVEIENTMVYNHTYAGIRTFNSDVSFTNCLIANCGSYAVALLVGGSYEFNHCTIANYYRFSSRTEPSVVIADSIIVDKKPYVGEFEKANFGNCIIYGDQKNELGIGISHRSLNYYFDYCLIKLDPKDVDISDPNKYNNIYHSADTLFVSERGDNYTFDFELDTLSFAKDKGSWDIANRFPLDIYQNSRVSDLGPDLGAFERVE